MVRFLAAQVPDRGCDMNMLMPGVVYQRPTFTNGGRRLPSMH